MESTKIEHEKLDMDLKEKKALHSFLRGLILDSSSSPFKRSTLEDLVEMACRFSAEKVNSVILLDYDDNDYPVMLMHRVAFDDESLYVSVFVIAIAMAMAEAFRCAVFESVAIIEIHNEPSHSGWFMRAKRCHSQAADERTCLPLSNFKWGPQPSFALILCPNPRGMNVRTLRLLVNETICPCVMIEYFRNSSQDRGLGLDLGQGLGPGQGHLKNKGQGLAPEVVEGNTLYVTGLSSRVTERDLEEHFSKEGKVASCFLVVEPRTRISRGFAFITMDTVEDANRCIKYLNQSVLEGRYITVERVLWSYSEYIASAILAAIKDDQFIHSRRKRARTPTPGHYLGLKSTRDYGKFETAYRGGGSGRDDYAYRGERGRSPRRSPYRGGRDYSPRHSPPPYGGRTRRDRSRSLPYSPYGSPDRRYARGSR
ncbi:hypothetical protein V8G54_014541 [Vigna mungo]|uniref:RRM domain-containing protein n=1 Tax=Vigna mungo TaxID=3915 RepID=A0AAQ3NJ86_VIGMU